MGWRGKQANGQVAVSQASRYSEPDKRERQTGRQMDKQVGIEPNKEKVLRPMDTLHIGRQAARKRVKQEGKEGKRAYKHFRIACDN